MSKTALQTEEITQYITILWYRSNFMGCDMIKLMLERGQWTPTMSKQNNTV